MVSAYVTAAVVAGIAAVCVTRNARLAFWWHWDWSATSVALLTVAAIDGAGAAILAGLAMHWELEPLGTGSARGLVNGGVYGTCAFVILRTPIDSFGLDMVAPARLLRRLFADRMGPILEECAQRSIARRAGELRPPQLAAMALQLFKQHAAPALDADERNDELTALRAKIASVLNDRQGENEDWSTGGRSEALIDLRITVAELAIEYGDSLVDLKLRHANRVPNDDYESRVTSLGRTMLGPVAALVVAALATWQIVVGELERAAIAGIAGIAFAWFAGHGLARRRQLRRLLRNKGREKRRIDTLSMESMALGRDDRPPWAADATIVGPDAKQLEAELGSRRLVLLVGERLTGRSRAVFEMLQAQFGDHVLLRPSVTDRAGNPPLTTLLAPGVLPFRHRYVLWLEDIGKYVEAGLEPRLIERWLAGGLGRVAVATITVTELEEIEDSGSQALVPLERAVQLSFEMPSIEAAYDSPARRYHQLTRSDPEAGRILQIVAACELLGLQGPTATVAHETYQTLTGQRLAAHRIATMIAELDVPLTVTEQRLSTDPEIVKQVEYELRGRTGIPLINALTLSLGSGEALLRVGAALAARRAFQDAERAYLRAEEVGPRELRPTIVSRRAALGEARQPSGAILSQIGGLDFPESMGPQQRKRALERLEEHTDDAFDATLPPADEGFATRFYRLTVYRGLARVLLLFTMDSLAVAAGAAVALAIRAAAQHHPEAVFSGKFVALLVPGALLVVTVAVGLGLYRADGPRARLGALLGTMSVLTTVVAAGFLVARVDVGSLVALAALFAVAFVVSGGLRYAYDRASRTWVRSRGLRRRVLFAGTPSEVRQAARAMKAAPGRPVQFVAFLSGAGANDLFNVGDYPDLDIVVRDLHIHELVIVDQNIKPAEKRLLIEVAHTRGVDVKYLVKDDEIALGVGRVDDYGLVHVPAALITPEAVKLKQAMDVVLVTATLPAWASIIVGYAAYSKLRRRGQPIFVQATRIGLGGTGFTMLRLRTRQKHLDGTRGELPSGRVEDWMERTGFDELPQLINVLRWDMSTVGPRPLEGDEARDLSPTERRTLGARPGITGRWQIAAGYGRSEAHGRMMDVDYLRRWRITHDLELIMRTSLVILRRGYYLGDTKIKRMRRTRWLASDT